MFRENLHNLISMLSLNTIMLIIKINNNQTTQNGICNILSGYYEFNKIKIKELITHQLIIPHFPKHGKFKTLLIYQ